ncbi:FecR family protein [Foetidibacter luteolus]|uniref:FecR family protein n=1 Tax=Foetidibacter luteolus TaxID=2608880 RepID=UPI00129BB7D2|nr:FecR family protein [Foetidibacter luteolus]
MEEKQFEQALQRFLHDEITPGELELFMHEAGKENRRGAIEEVLRSRLENKIDQGFSDEAHLQQMFAEVLTKAGFCEDGKEPDAVPVNVIKRFSFKRLAAAATIIGLVGFALYFFSSRNRNTPTLGAIQITGQSKDVMPGGNKALLTLADGSTIVLDSARQGSLSQQGSTTIIKMDDGQLAYMPGLEEGAVMYNTIVTPRGGTYKVILPDGTKVWLNAASSLRFPTSFSGAYRSVDITGEAYFEVNKMRADDRNIPFVVHINNGSADGLEVEVLGTHFNVMAYNDEKTVKTTLLEGSVKVSNSNSSVVLDPMQQAQFTKVNNSLKVAGDVNTDVETAWINGMFHYRDANLETIMRQLCRWYDVEVSYSGPVPEDHFTGKIPRNITLEKALKILELSDVRFKIEGRRIIVTA